MVPNGWLSSKLGSVCQIINGRPFKPHEWRESGLPIIRIQNLNGSTEYNYYDGEFSDKVLIKSGQLLFAWSGSKGTSFGPHIWNGPDGLLNYHTWRMNVNDDVDSEFFFQYLRVITTRIEGKAHGASALVHTQKGEMEKFPIVIPPLPEQRKIAKILSTWDKAISTTERLIDNSKQQKKGLMQQLLTGKKRLLDDSGKPFEGEWEEVVLKDLCSKVIDNRGKTPPLSEIGLPLVEINSIVNSKYPKLSKVIKFVSPETFKTWFRNGHPERGDILVATVGSAGISALVNLDEGFGSIAQNLIAIRPNSKADSSFLYYLMNTPHYFSLVRAVVMGAVQPSLKVPHLLSFKMKIPSISEQQKIASVLGNVDKEVELLAQQLADLKQEKKALMQQLLTGKRRVNVEQKDVA